MSEKTIPQEKQQHKLRRIALDKLPWGDEAESGKKLPKKLALPESLTSKELYTDIVTIAWPSLVELLLTQLTGMADMMMVGGLGSWAITATGLTTQPKFLLSTMFMALNVGVMSMVARHKGAGRQDKARLVLRQGLMMNLFLSVFCAIIGYVLAEPMVTFMGGETERVIAAGVDYLRIQMIGLPFLALTTAITNALRGAGDSKTALFYNTTANVVNVILNYLLIGGNLGFPRLEVAGASLATSISQVVAMCIALFAVLKPTQYVRLELKKGFKPDKEAIGDICRIGFPSMIEQLCMRAGMLVFALTVNSLGETMIACHSVCMNVNALTFMTGQAFAVSATSLVGQSLGKRRSDMAVHYSRRTQRIGLIVSFLLALVLFFFGEPILKLYTDDPDILRIGPWLLKMIALVQPFQSSQFIFAGALRGAGDTKFTAKVTFITVMITRPAVALFAVLVLKLGLPGAWIALVCDQMLRTILITFRYNSGKWQTALKRKAA